MQINAFVLGLSLISTLTLQAQGSLTVVFPKGGEVICPSHGDMTVTWSCSGLPAGTLINVDLCKNGTVTNHIFRNIPITPSSKKWGEMFISGASGSYTVRITTVDGSCSAESAAPFTLAHVGLAVKMESPKGGESLVLGKPFRIQWSYSGCPWGVPSVEITLCRSPWNFWNDVVGQITVNPHLQDLYYDWPVGDLRGGKVVPPGSDYKVQVYSLAIGPTAAICADPHRPWLSAAPFTILPEGSTPPSTAQPNNQPAGPAPAIAPIITRLPQNLPVLRSSLTLMAPAGGERWHFGESRKIAWDWKGKAHRPLNLLLYRNNQLLGTLAQGLGTEQAFYPWKIPETLAGKPLESGGGYVVEALLPASNIGQEMRARSAAPFTLSKPDLKALPKRPPLVLRP